MPLNGRLETLSFVFRAMAVSRTLNCHACRAPLPKSEGSTVECSYCKSINVLGQSNTQEVRAVLRQELGRAATDAQTKAVPAAMIGILGVSMLLGVLGFVVLRLNAEPPPATPAVIAGPPLGPPPLPVRPKPPPLPAPTFGEIHALGLVDTELLVLSERKLTSIDLVSRKQRWTVTASGRDVRLVFAGATIAIASPMGAFFLSRETGERIASYLWKTPHFKVVACSTVSGEFIMKTVFDGTYRFDASGQRAVGRGECKLNDNIPTDSGQRVVWGGLELDNLECRYRFLRNDSQVSFCTEEGTRAQFVVDVKGRNVRWRSLGGSPNPTYVAEHQGVLLVGGSRSIEAFDADSGKRRWAFSANQSTVATSDGVRVYTAHEGSVVELDVLTGEERGRINATRAVDSSNE
jgi:LSD1 subclass zinc finger protein